MIESILYKTALIIGNMAQEMIEMSLRSGWIELLERFLGSEVNEKNIIFIGVN